MKTTIKIFYLILFVLTLQIISLAQDLRFAVTDGVSLNSQDGVENFTKLINTINQFEDLDFVVFNNIKSELKFNDRETQNLIRKISPPVYFMPSQYEFLFDRGAREKFYETFGEFNFNRNLDSLKVLGLNSVVSWTPDPFFEREVFNFLKSSQNKNDFSAVLILNNSPTDIKNFDQAVELLDTTKVKFILAPLNSNRTIEKDRITLVNSKNNQRKSEAIKVISLNSDTLNVITHRLDGSLIDQEKIVIKGRAFTERTTDTTYDPDKLEKWSFDLGYSLASKISVNNDRIYAADVSGQVVCLNTNGKKLWEYFSFGYVYSSPTVRDNYLAVATIQGDLETIDSRNGKLLQTLGFDSPITSDLASFDFNGPINFMIPKQTKSEAAVLMGTGNGELFCYDLETLQEHWRFNEAGGAIVGKPLFVKDHVIFYSLDGNIYSLNSATGLLTWKAKLTGKNEKNIYASDPVTNYDNIFIALSNGKLFSFNILLGKKNWEYDKYNLTTSLNISEDGRLLYAKSSDDRFHILSAELGTWVKEIYTKIGKHYTNSDITETNDDIYFGNDVGFVYHIDSKYRINKLYRKTNSTIHSVKIIDKDKLIIASHDGIISLLKSWKMMPQFKTYVFDVDGTLAHTNKLIFETFRYVAEKYLEKKVTDEEIISLFGPTEDVILKEWMKDRYDIARNDYFDFYTNEHEKMVKTFDGLDKVLDDIKSSGKNLAVFTGKGKQSTEITLEKLGMKDYFELVVTGDDVAGHKPAPDGLFKVMEYFNNKSDEILMIGDSPHDITASKEAKVPIAAVIWDSYAADEIPAMNPDYLFKSVQEFRSFIKSTL